MITFQFSKNDVYTVIRMFNFTWECTICGCSVTRHRPEYPKKLVKRQSYSTNVNGEIQSKDDAKIELAKVFENDKKEYESLQDEVYNFISSIAKLNSFLRKNSIVQFLDKFEVD